MNSPPPNDDAPPQFAEQRRTSLKQMALFLIAVAAIGICAPVTNVYAVSHCAAFGVVGTTLLTVGVLRGARVIFFPNESEKVLVPTIVGLVSSILLLIAAAKAIPLSILNFSVRPSWIFLCAGGAIVIVFCAAAFIGRLFGRRIVT